MVLKVVPSYHIHSSLHAIYSEYPEFQKRIEEARQLYRSESECINLASQDVIAVSSGYTSGQVRQLLDKFNADREAAHKRFESAVDLAHQELGVPYLVDCLSALMMTGLAVYHNERPVLPGIVTDILQASVSTIDKDADGNTDLVQVHYAQTVVISRSSFMRWGLDDTIGGVLNSATWEAVTGPDYWLNKLSANNAAGFGWSCIHQNPYCRIYGENSGIFSLVSEGCDQIELSNENQVNEQLRKWNVPLIGWE